MSVRVVRLGASRLPDEGPRLGTVRRPPRGAPKAEFASGNWYDLSHCHRSVLRSLLEERGAKLA